MSHFKNRVLFGLNCCLLVGAWGCATRDIHPELTETKEVLVRQWTIPTHTVWQAGERGAEFSHPILVDGVLVFGADSVGLMAIYPELTRVKWQLKIPEGVNSDILHHGGQLYFVAQDGFFYSVQLENGRVNWKYNVRTTFASRPTVEGGRVFLTTADDTVYAFDAGSGEWIWHYKRRSSSSATIRGASAPLVDGGEVIVGLSDGFLVGLDPNDGKLKWEKKLHTGRKFTDIDASPIIESGIVYVPTYDGALFALQRKSKEVIWRFDSGGAKDVALDGGRLYLPSSDGFVYCLLKESAKQLWKFELDDGVPTRVTWNDRYLIVGSSHQYLYVLDKETGKPVYRYNVGQGSGFYSSPLIATKDLESGEPQIAKGNSMYILSGGGNLMSFFLRSPARGQSWLGYENPRPWVPYY